MIRSANHSSYPKVGESPLDQQLRSILRARARGETGDEEVAEVEDEVATLALAEQARAFIDLVTDGLIRWDGPTAPLARHLDGLATGRPVRWFETNLYERQLVVTGPIRHRGSFLRRELEVARSVALDRPVKLVLPGPVTAARRCHDPRSRPLEERAGEIARALAAEVSALSELDARIFQLDEPCLCRHPEDLDLVRRTAGEVFDAAGEGATTILSTYFGDLTALGERVADLPGTHLGLDLVASDASFEVLDRLPPGKGVVLGLFDPASTVQEDAADVARRLEPHRERLVERDVMVGPAAGLELLPRDAAFEKLLHARYLVEKLAAEWTWA